MRSIACLLLLLASTGAIFAQNHQPDDQLAAIRAAQKYMDAYYTANPAQMQLVLHPDFRKHTLQNVNGRLETIETSGESMLEGVRAGSGKRIPTGERVQHIELLDMYKDAANVKVTTGRWIDYMLLSKVNGEWRVLDVVLQYTER